MFSNRLDTTEVINLVSSSPSKSATPSSTSKIPRIRTPVFESFRERWLKFDREVFQHGAEPIAEENAIAKDDCLIVSETLDNANLLDNIPLGRIRRAARGPPVDKDCDQKAKFQAATDPWTIEKSRPVYSGQRSSRAPRVKAKALQEIILVIDDRLQTRMMTATCALQGQMGVFPARLCRENAITWRQLTCNARQEVETPFILFIFDAQDLYPEIKTGEPLLIESFLRKWRASIPTIYSNVYMLVTGGRSLGSRVAAEINRQFRRCVMSGSKLRLTPTKKLPTWAEIEQVLWLTGFELGVHVQFLERAAQLPEHLLEMSRCIAWQPYAHRHDHHNFCLLNSKRSGKSLAETWKLMLEEIGRVSSPIADAIVAIFPTVASLMVEYDSLPPEVASSLLSTIVIPGNQKRCVGAAVSQRIYRVLTSNTSTARANAI